MSHSELAFNSYDTLLWYDVKFLGDTSVKIHRKITKNKTPGGDVIDLFEFEGNCCPVASIKHLYDTLPHNLIDPVFRFDSGKLLTQKLFNETLYSCLHPIFGEKASNYSGHSFRAALPSALASCQSLSSEKAIKKWGRWKSNSFEKYTRLNHTAKREVFELFKSALNS